MITPTTLLAAEKAEAAAKRPVLLLINPDPDTRENTSDETNTRTPEPDQPLRSQEIAGRFPREQSRRFHQHPTCLEAIKHCRTAVYVKDGDSSALWLCS